MDCTLHEAAESLTLLNDFHRPAKRQVQWLPGAMPSGSALGMRVSEEIQPAGSFIKWFLNLNFARDHFSPSPRKSRVSQAEGQHQCCKDS